MTPLWSGLPKNRSPVCRQSAPRERQAVAFFPWKQRKLLIWPQSTKSIIWLLTLFKSVFYQVGEIYAGTIDIWRFGYAALKPPVAQKWSDARAVANTALPSCKWALINQSPGGMISATVTTGEKFCHSTVTYILGESRKRDVFSPHFQSKKAFYNYMWRPTLIRNKCNESGAVVDLFHSRAWLCRILCRMWSERRLALRRILSP